MLKAKPLNKQSLADADADADGNGNGNGDAQVSGRLLCRVTTIIGVAPALWPASVAAAGPVSVEPGKALFDIRCAVQQRAAF